MHIAICDDNVADRKQLERLLKREADKRTAVSGGFYVDSYGDLEALLRSPMLYDVFFFFLCHGSITGMDVAAALYNVGVSAPVTLCSSLISYREQNLPQSILFLDKPIKVNELSAVLDHSLAFKQSAIPHIELREESGSYHYVKESDFMYAVSAGRYLKITLKDGRVLSVLSTLDNLFSQLASYPVFFPLNNKVLVNGRYLNKISLLTATMTDGTVFRIAPGSLTYAKYALKEFRPESPQDT